METAYIGLGSNLGDSSRVVLDGWVELGTLPGVHLGTLSHPYRTEPVDMISDNWFINAAGELKTTLPPLELMDCLHRVEKQFGRRRGQATSDHQDRILDFDLLLYGQSVLDKQDVIVPHPSMQDRLFVLLPLCEIANNILHPVLKKSMGELLVTLQKSVKNPSVQMEDWPQNKEERK